MNEKLADALSYVDDRYITEAASRRHKKHRILIAVAAVLAVVIFLNVPSIPLAVSAHAVSLAPKSRAMERPDPGSEEWKAWVNEQEKRNAETKDALVPVWEFTPKCSEEVLSGTDDVNRLWSPINAYIALAMTAEVTDGATRQEVLDALGVQNMDQLRRGVSAMWESVHQDNGKEISVIANSLWLDEDVSYEQGTMDLLAQSYYASVYQGDLGSRKTNGAMGNWLKNQTGGFFGNQTPKVNMPEDAMLGILSTIYFQSKWCHKFSQSENTSGVFHANSGEIPCTFMNKKEMHLDYSWGESYGAVSLAMENGSSMWLILPDEGKTTDDVLKEGEYTRLFAPQNEEEEENTKRMKVNLSVPKFDVSNNMDLKESLQKIGVNQIFEMLGNDFSPSVRSEIPVYLDNISQNVRVEIDEKGVTAASYIQLNLGAGASEPPKEIIDFVLDRPFLFFITSAEGVPLFSGTINTPKNN